MTRSDHLSPVPGSPAPGQPGDPWEQPTDLDDTSHTDRADSVGDDGVDGPPPFTQFPVAWFQSRPREWQLAAIAAGALVVVVPVIAIILKLIQASFTEIGQAGHFAARLPDWAITRTITAPVTTFLSEHATGLPVSVDDVGWLWLITTIGFFLLATAGARGARLGWILSGVLTTGAVVAGSPLHNAPVVGGVTVLLWAVLSLFALRRLPDGGPEVVVVPPQQHTPTRDRDTDRDDVLV